MANSKLQHCFYGLLICCLLMADKVNGQSIVTVMEGVKTCQTTALRNWTPDPNDPVLKIKTRDEKGLIHAQDLERLVLKKYGQQRSNASKEINENFFQLPIEKKAIKLPVQHCWKKMPAMLYVLVRDKLIPSSILQIPALL